MRRIHVLLHDGGRDESRPASGAISALHGRAERSGSGIPASFDRARLPQDCDPDAVGRGIFANEILPRTSFRRGAKGEKVVG